ncbi:hypothetical protein A1O1_01577 [Capronia coronata CBS 617.96]|uniref:Uncharacterized protein n=1 Tax=Capronia coronata CBS 617.96 TaxID=1182541 RepID=W9Z4D4_9EURO|nr:uncharacterized protein A1O1_01577 [Capronia coronata CBS 617.96]EXJ96451.1 hypothetical protein A1O1_01577 [Capronia coronata CBS 617.96]
MQLTASTVAAILAFTVAQVGALPSPQQTTTGDSVAATQTPPPPSAPESVPVYYPEEEFYIEKRWTPSNHPGQGEGHGQGNGMPPKWQGGVQGNGGTDRHPYQGQHGGPSGMGFGSHGFHGPMPDSDEYDGYDDDVQVARGARRAINLDFSPEDHDDVEPAVHPLGRRAINMKQYKWYEYQTRKPFMGLVGGNPNIRNLNFRDQSRTLGMGLRRRDAAPPMARSLVPTRYREPMERGHFGPMPDEVEGGDFYYYPYDEEN